MVALKSLLLMTLHLSFPSSTLGKLKKGLRSFGAFAAALGIFSMCSLAMYSMHVCVLCVPGCIDLYGAASQTCLPERTEDKGTRQNGHSYCTAWLLGTFHASVTMETQHWFSLEGDNKPHSGGASSFAPWQKGR